MSSIEDFTSKGSTCLNLVLSDQPKNCTIFNKHLTNHSFDGDEFDASEYLRNVYQTCHDINISKESGKKLNPILQRIKQDKIGWKHPCYDNAAFKQHEHDDYLVTPFHVEEGVNECKRCKSRRVISYQIQERSSDEPMSTYCTCIKCGAEWKYSG
jgi:DNA-directed RNA polymerase subunit M/transcription elongation factor TFIIS